MTKNVILNVKNYLKKNVQNMKDVCIAMVKHENFVVYLPSINMIQNVILQEDLEKKNKFREPNIFFYETYKI